MMDLARLTGAAELSGEVCVIGAGAAGISLTRRLLSAGHQVILLESGGVDYEAAIAELNAGDNIGLDYYDLEDSRLRFFGGTTAIWGGRCAEFEPIDLEKRDYVPHSGWPIGWAELDRYYEQARPLFGLPRARPTIEAARAARLPVPHFDPELLKTPFWTFDEVFSRFTFDSCADLRNHPRCQLVLHATVKEIRASASGTGVESVEAVSLQGARLTVRARTCVLAAGGIENPRILLASRSVMRTGLGNDHDQVGRYFMEHPHARGGRVFAGASWQLLKVFGRRHRINGCELAALIAPAEALQRRAGILNTSLTIVARQPEGARKFVGMRAYEGVKHKLAPTKGARALWLSTKKLAAWSQMHIDPARPWMLHKIGNLDIALLVRAEQAPNPDSRVKLSGELDAAGVPRVALDWRLSEIDVRSVAVLVETLGGELKRLGLGEVETARWLSESGATWRTDPLISSHPIGGYHHMGTTRMSENPRTGATDADGRVHGIGNLYVAGSSLFPTGGWANPTLTIVALALRTADAISAELNRSSPQVSEPAAPSAPVAGALAVAGIGANATKLWGLTADERLRRIAKAQKLPVADEQNAPVLANLGYAWDPGWLKHVAGRPDTVVTLTDVPVLAHCTRGDDRRQVAEAMKLRQPFRPSSGLEVAAHEQSGGLANTELRKRERPFMDRLEPETVRSLERASYFGAYKGVTDILTKYLWPEWALVLTRLAVRIGATPNMVTALGAALCVAATILFYYGWYWTGIAVGLGFMVLDTVDGKLARCTITSSWWGNIFDHGIDLVHPPFWWYAWGAGLAASGRPLADSVFWTVMAVVVGGYVVQRVVEGIFIRRFGMHIHVWQRFDSQFRLITARRNPNMVILFASLLIDRPDWGLVAVAAWTLISLGVHFVRIVQAYRVQAQGRPVVSWLS